MRNHPIFRQTLAAVCILSFACLAVPAALRADTAPLADRVPGDALIYAGWRGVDDMGPGYAESHLKAVLERSHFRELTERVIPGLIAAGVEQEGIVEEAEAASAMVQPLLEAAWRHPVAFYFGGLAMDEQLGPMPRAAILCQAGDEAAALHEKLEQLLADVPPGGPPIDIERRAGLVVLSIGPMEHAHRAAMGLVDADADAEADADIGRLTDRAAFRRGLERTLASPVAAAHVNIEGLLELVDRLAEMRIEAAAEWDAPPPQDVQQFMMMKQVLGLDGFKHATAAMGFDGREWGTRVFIAAPAPRRGLGALFDPRPLPDELMQAIPASAISAGGAQFDLARLFHEVQRGLRQIDPQAEAQLEAAMDDIAEQLGVRPMEDVFAALGPAWACYRDPGVGGEGLGGLVVVNRLRQPERIEAAIEKLVPIANAALAEHGPPDGRLHIRSEEIDGTKVHYLALPLVSPALAVRDGNLYITAFPEMAAAAAHHVASGGMPLLRRQSFIELRQRLGVEQPGGFYYADTPRLLSRVYPTMVAGTRVLLGAADMMGVEEVPATILPPLYRLRPHIGPSAMFTWADDEGFYLRAIESVPGAGALGAADGGMAAPMLVGIMLPAVASARQAAQRVTSLNNARQIAQASLIHAQDHRGQAPPNLAVLIEEHYIMPDALFSPGMERAVPGHLEGEQLARWVDEHASYIYLGEGVNFDRIGQPFRFIIAYERPEHAPAPGEIAVAFADGHVRSLPVHEAKQMIDRQLEGQQDQNRRAPAAPR